MSLADDRILEYLRENETAGATEMSKNGVRYSQGYISKRCKKLLNHGLIRHLGNGVYAITERGEKYLDGELDTSEDAPDEVNNGVSNGPTASDSENEV
jgi:repressor of nif and glnA expression